VREIELILREEAGIWGAWSPSVQGFYVTADSAHECVSRAKKMADAELGEPVNVFGHHERVVDGLVVRVAGRGPGFDLRVAVAQRLETLIRYDRAQIDDDGLTHNRLGEIIYVCALPDDSVGWLAAQMDERGDGLQVAALLDHVGRPAAPDKAHFIWSAGIRIGDDIDGPTLQESGMSLETTVADYLRTMVPTRPETPTGPATEFMATRAVTVA
jgi:hypothetical protein